MLRHGSHRFTCKYTMPAFHWNGFGKCCYWFRIHSRQVITAVVLQITRRGFFYMYYSWTFLLATEIVMGLWVTSSDPWPPWPIQYRWPMSDPLSSVLLPTPVIAIYYYYSAWYPLYDSREGGMLSWLGRAVRVSSCTWLWLSWQTHLHM